MTTKKGPDKNTIIPRHNGRGKLLVYKADDGPVKLEVCLELRQKLESGSRCLL